MFEQFNYKGAEWVKVDLHLHSPCVETFKLSNGINLTSENDKREIAKEYVKRLKVAEIKIGAITDYNGIREDWFNLIKEVAEKEEINIFPGVELNIGFGAGGKYGVHLLIIFQENESIASVNNFIHSLDKDYPHKGLFKDRRSFELNPKEKLEEIIKNIRGKFDCLIIFCHPNEDKGLLKSFEPKQCAKYIKLIKPDALEYFDENFKKKLLSTDEISSEELDKIAIIENSDPKSLDEIGNKKRNDKPRATYLKLSDFALQAIKLALHDPSVRLKLYEKPQMNFNKITKIKINGTTFLGDIDLPLSPELNTFIGGRGVGKSAIIESMRYCMDLPVYSEPEIRKKFVSEVVGSGGEIEIEVEKFYGEQKLTYLFKRTMGKELEIFDTSTKQKISLNTHQLFEGKSPILIGQKELYYVASDKKFQLSLIDELIGEEVKNKQREFEDTIKKLKENGDQIIKLKEKLIKKEQYEQELKNIEDEIQVFDKLKVVDKLKKWTDLIDNEQRIIGAEEKLKEISCTIKNAFSESIDILKSQIEHLKKAKPEGKESVDSTLNILIQFGEYLEELLKSFSEKTKRTSTNYEEIKNNWNNLKNKVEQEMDEIRKQLGREKLKPERLEELINKRAQLQSLISGLKKFDNELKNKTEEREKIKEEVKNKRHELFKTRQREIEKINQMLEDRARIRIEFEKEAKTFKGELKNLLAGSGIRTDVIENITKKEDLAIDGLTLSKFIEEGEIKLKEEFNLTDTMAKKFKEYFSNDKLKFELEILFPDDKVIIELKVGEQFKPIEELSVGQKATALLLLLLAHEDRILILDQPEEDLDNRFIYEDVVKILRKLKGKRQIITATHNANIPVIGDSELIVVLEAEKNKCKIIEKGSVDKNSIKQLIKNIMEGGEEAFKLRIEKYGRI